MNQCLLPLANTALLDHTLEFLVNAGIEEVFLYVSADDESIEKHLEYVNLPPMQLHYTTHPRV